MATNSLRVAYGESLVELGKENKQIVVLEADLCKSTMGILFEQEFPERFYEMGIAEANMACVAGGLSLAGYIPFMATFAVFATGRCYDQIRTSICIPSLNVKICGSSAGLSDFGDGSTHQSIEDIATMRVLPHMSVFSPADANQTIQIMRYMANHKGPMYIRINRNELPLITLENAPFVPGEIQVMSEGTDATIFATGVMVSQALEAQKQLKSLGISLKVINVPSIKPIDDGAVRQSINGVTAILTAEEHSTIGGLGSTILECLAPCSHPPVKCIGIEDCFGTSAENYDVLLEGYGLTSHRIVEETQRLLCIR